MFTWLLDFSLKNRMIVILLSAISMVYGAYTLSKMPVDVFPDLNKPTVTIMTEAASVEGDEHGKNNRANNEFMARYANCQCEPIGSRTRDW